MAIDNYPGNQLGPIGPGTRQAAWTTILADIEPGEPGSPAVQTPEADDNPT